MFRSILLKIKKAETLVIDDKREELPIERALVINGAGFRLLCSTPKLKKKETKTMSEDYLPDDEPGLDEWFQNWKAKMTESGSAHGFSTGEVKQAQDDADMARNVIAGSATVETNRREFIRFKRLMLYGSRNAPTPAYPALNTPVTPPLNGELMAGIVERTRSFVRRLKESPNYNEAVGADFRVLPVEGEGGISEDEAKPVLKARAMAQSKVDIDFTRGDFDGVEVERQRGDNINEWQSTGRFYKSPAEDDAPPAGGANAPETRRYRARYLKGNKPVGVYSDIVTVVTQP